MVVGPAVEPPEERHRGEAGFAQERRELRAGIEAHRERERLLVAAADACPRRADAGPTVLELAVLEQDRAVVELVPPARLELARQDLLGHGVDQERARSR